MNNSPRIKLFLMMVLQFFIWGAWLPLIFGYLPALEFKVWQQIMVLNAFPAAAILGMFFSNQFADRNFAAERFLAFSHLVGGAAMFALAWVTSFPLFFTLMLVHCLLYVPTISITNSIAFANMKDPQREFGLIRMGGTIGWILAAWPFIFILVDWDKISAANPVGFKEWLGTALDSANALSGKAWVNGVRWSFMVAGIASFALALFSLSLPHTPPKKVDDSSANKLAWLEAAKLLGVPFIFILWIVAFIDSTVHNLYFQYTDRFLRSIGIAANWVTPIMSIGQVAEILTMFILGATLRKLGWRITMIVGILGHAARFGVFAYFPENHHLVIWINVLHGICYAFFFATVYIFVDEFLPKDARASAQGLFNLMILGFGAIAANFVGPVLLAQQTVGEVINWKNLFLIPASAAVVAAILLALLFRPPARKETADIGPAVTPH